MEFGELTKILHTLNNENHPSDDVMDEIYLQLRQVARQQVSRQDPGSSVQATALANEAYMRICSGKPNEQWNDRNHFFACAAAVMRRILIDRARKHAATKHGGRMGRRAIDCDKIMQDRAPQAILDMNDALETLEEREPKIAELVRLRFFVGLTIAETARALDISVRTANRRWKFARAWLRCELSDSKN